MSAMLATLLAVAALAPSAETRSAADVTATGATLGGTVDDVSGYYFQYGTSTAYGASTEPQPFTDEDDPVDVEAEIGDLSANTTYHFRVVGTAGGVAVATGDDLTFRTAANPAPPGVGNQRVRDIGPTSATVTATVNPNRSDTTYFFQYGRRTSYGARTPELRVPAGTSPVAVTAQLSNLRAYSRYHWRLVARNAVGTTRGTRRSFRTARLPSAASIGLSRRTVTWGGITRVGGRVSGVGVGGITLALQQQRFPLDQDFTTIETGRTGGDGGYLFTIPALWTTTRYRVVTQTQVAVTSPVATARSAVKVGARARHRTRRRARIEGKALPGVHGRASLQRYRRGRGWRQVKSKRVRPADELRTPYRFSVRRPRGRRAKPYRLRVVVAPVRGAHVRGKSRTVRVKPRRR